MFEDANIALWSSEKTISKLRGYLSHYKISTNRDKIYGFMIDGDKKVLGHFYKPVNPAKKLYTVRVKHKKGYYVVRTFVANAVSEMTGEEIENMILTASEKKKKMPVFFQVLKLALFNNMVELNETIHIVRASE